MNTLRCTSLLATAALLAGSATAGAGVRPTVVELYTSQGCSSCPPADALLGELAKRSDILALAFHVDYWDDLGWRDRFDLPVSAQRQSRYARHLGVASVYTPQMVIDGSVDALGSDRQRLTQLLSVPRDGIAVHATVSGDELAVSVDAVAAALKFDVSQPYDVALVSYLRNAETAIGRGENSGRLLKEFNVVRSMSTLGNWQGAAGEWHVKLKSLPADATNVAVLVQQSNFGAIVGAVSAALP